MTLYNNAAVTDLISFISKLMLSKCIKQWCETSPYCLTIWLSNDWDCKVLFYVFRVVGAHVIVVLSVLSLRFFFVISIVWDIDWLIYCSPVCLFSVLNDFCETSFLSEWFIYCSPQGVFRLMLCSMTWHSVPHPSQN